MGKAAYVRSQEQTRVHHCQWPGCDKQVPPAMWGCRTHWYALPAGLRASIWATYRPGQERNGTPSTEYLDAARAVQTWITQETAPPPPTESTIAAKCQRIERSGEICGLTPPCPDCGSSLIDVPEGSL